ncbi:MAG: hypothetical protein WAO83_20975, partial [Fuerstiella sp.]
TDIPTVTLAIAAVSGVSVVMGYTVRSIFVRSGRRVDRLLCQLVIDRLPTRRECTSNLLMKAVKVLVDQAAINLELDVTARTERTVIGKTDLLLQANGKCDCHIKCLLNELMKKNSHALKRTRTWLRESRSYVVANATLRNDRQVALELQLVPVDHLRRQIVGFGVEVDFKRISHAETTLADRSDIFAGRISHQLFKLHLRHSVYSKGKRKRRPEVERRKKSPPRRWGKDKKEACV